MLHVLYYACVCFISGQAAPVEQGESRGPGGTETAAGVAQEAHCTTEAGVFFSREKPVVDCQLVTYY